VKGEKMRQRKSIIMFLLITGILSSLFGQSTDDVVIKFLPSGKAYYPYEESWAVLIGINKFNHCPNLEFAVQDAKDLGKLLIKDFEFRPDHITFISDEKANLKNIRKVLGDDLRKKVGKNDRLLIFWAGHGHTVSLPEGGEMGYIIPVDGDVDEYYSTCLSMEEIKTLAELIPAKHILFLMDACYSGLATNRPRSVFTSKTAAYLKKITRARGRQIITAGSKDEEVIENSVWGHSVFTYKLIEGLGERLADDDEDGIITTTELSNYLKSTVTRLSEFRQTPQYRFFHGDGEFVFISNKIDQITKTGMIHIRTTPWCKVFVNGVEVCTSPFIIKDVPLGKHQLMLKREGYSELIKEITITENSRIIKILEELKKE